MKYSEMQQVMQQDESHAEEMSRLASKRGRSVGERISGGRVTEFRTNLCKGTITPQFGPRPRDLQGMLGSRTEGSAGLVKAYFLTQISGSQLIICIKDKNRILNWILNLTGSHSREYRTVVCSRTLQPGAKTRI